MVKLLYEKGYTRQDILELFRFIDWLLVLPEELEESFSRSIAEYEEEKDMPYITSVERLGIKKGMKLGEERGIEKGILKGMQEGMQKGTLETVRENILQVLEVRFDFVPEKINQALKRIRDIGTLKALLKFAVTAPSIDDFADRLVTPKSQRGETS